MPNKSVSKRPRSKKKSTVQASTSPRTLSAPKAIWYKPLSWRHRPPVPVRKPIPKARKLFATTVRQLWAHKKLFGGIVLIYGLLNLILVRGLSGSNNLETLKSSLDALANGAAGKIISAATTFSYLLTSSGSGSATAGVYQSILFLVCSLAFIWGLRQIVAGHKVRIRDTFYQGMYPMIPFLLIFGLISLQLLPLAGSGALYSLVTTNGIAIGFWERGLFIALLLVFGFWSLRMITATIFAFYIATLPNMAPLQAYRSARQLVYGRRLLLWRKIIFLLLALIVIAAAIEIPLIFFATPVAVWMFFILSMLALPLIHGYLYNLYREML